MWCDEKPTGGSRAKSSERSFDQTPVQESDSYMATESLFGPGLDQSLWLFQMFSGAPTGWQKGLTQSAWPRAPVNPGEQQLHVSQSVNQPCKLLPSWHKVPLIIRVGPSCSGGVRWCFFQHVLGDCSTISRVKIRSEYWSEYWFYWESSTTQ